MGGNWLSFCGLFGEILFVGFVALCIVGHIYKWKSGE